MTKKGNDMLTDTPLCDFGWKAPTFMLPGTDGHMHDFTELMGEKGLLVAFICNHCPFVIAVIDRLASDAAALKAEGINTVAIMSNDYQAYPADAPHLMVEFAAKHQLPFPYLIDETQEVATAYGAICTPDFFGLNAEGRLQYRGRIDDAQRGDATNRTPELLDAMRLVAQTGSGPADQKASMGCSIKWK